MSSEATHKHVKSGLLVREIGRGFAQVSAHPIEEMSAVSIYEHDGKLWVRNAVEFDDGRFEKLEQPFVVFAPEVPDTGGLNAGFIDDGSLESTAVRAAVAGKRDERPDWPTVNATYEKWKARAEARLAEAAAEMSRLQENYNEAYQATIKLQAKLTAATEDNKRLREALTKLVTTATLLHQNSIGCAVNHYGNDIELHGLPGWLNDAEKDIVAGSVAQERGPER